MAIEYPNKPPDPGTVNGEGEAVGRFSALLACGEGIDSIPFTRMPFPFKPLKLTIAQMVESEVK